MSTIMLPLGFVDGQVGADRRGHRLLDDVHGLAGAGVLGASCTARCSTPVMPDGTQNDHARLAPAAGVDLLSG
jgi:hypothetical protein